MNRRIADRSHVMTDRPMLTAYGTIETPSDREILVEYLQRVYELARPIPRHRRGLPAPLRQVIVDVAVEGLAKVGEPPQPS
jgi:hypothetical protein